MFSQEAKLYKAHIIEEMRRNPQNVDEGLFKFPKPKVEDPSRCKAVLIDAPTQAGKTRKCFLVMQEKMQKMSGRTLCLYISQANSCSGAAQVKQRAANDPGFADYDIYLAADKRSDAIRNHMVIGYWNSRNTSKMLDIVTENHWDNIIVVVDECDSGNLRGVKDRLCFIRAVDRKSNSNVMVIFVTATIGNLSKNILRIAQDNFKKFSTGVVSEIVNKKVVEHQFAEPADNYVGASWFVENKNVWKKLDFGPRSKDMSKDEHEKIKETAVMKQINGLSFDAKELTLIVTSTRTADHARVSNKLTRCGYNVIVEVNNAMGKQFKVHYLSDGMDLDNWNIPFNAINAAADKGDLSEIREGGKRFKTGIDSKDDLSMPHILQAALFMNTAAEKRIRENTSHDEYMKLKAISSCMNRPKDFPTETRVALVAGHMAGRGITFQNPAIDFTCTSFCFTDTKDAITRGAANTQRFGRACGMLEDAFARPGRQPVLIATKGIVQAAVANERVVMDKAKEIPNGTMLSLKDLITEDEWKRIVKAVKKGDAKSTSSREDQSDTLERLEMVSRSFDKKNTIIHKIISKFIENKFESLTIKALNACSKRNTIFINDYTRWDSSRGSMKIIIEKSKGEFELSQAVKMFLNI